MTFKIELEWKCQEKCRDQCKAFSEIDDKRLTMKVLGGESVVIDIELVCGCQCDNTFRPSFYIPNLSQNYSCQMVRVYSYI